MLKDPLVNKFHLIGELTIRYFSNWKQSKYCTKIRDYLLAWSIVKNNFYSVHLRICPWTLRSLMLVDGIIFTHLINSICSILNSPYKSNSPIIMIGMGQANEWSIFLKNKDYILTWIQLFYCFLECDFSSKESY